MSDVEDAFFRGCLVSGTRRVCEAALRRRLEGDELLPLMSPAGLMNLFGTLACMAVAALAAGMTMGIVSLDAIDLRVKMRAGSPDERRCARLLLPIVEHEPHHQVLVTLLLMNSVAAEALPLFLDALVPTWAAIIVSVTAVLFVGEILPSAIFTGPARLRIAASLSSLLRCLIFVLAPLAWPLAKLLDRALPHEHSDKFSSRDEVGVLLEVTREAALEQGSQSPFIEDEADLVRGAMTLSKTGIKEVMLPVDRAFTVESTAVLDRDCILRIVDSGFSRIPVEHGGKLTSYFMVKELLRLMANDEINKRVSDLPMYSPVWIGPEHSLFELLNEFQTGSTHMAFVSNRAKKRTDAVGIVTLEDIIEVILTEEIYDEQDRSNAESKLKNFMENFVLPKLRGKKREAQRAKKNGTTSVAAAKYGALAPQTSPPAAAPLRVASRFDERNKQKLSLEEVVNITSVEEAEDKTEDATNPLI